MFLMVMVLILKLCCLFVGFCLCCLLDDLVNSDSLLYVMFVYIVKEGCCANIKSVLCNVQRVGRGCK